MQPYDPDHVVLQAAATDLDSSTVSGFILGALRLVHAQHSDVVTNTGESALGWTFFEVSVKPSLVRRLASLPSSEFQKLRGDSTDQKFVIWLNRLAQRNGLDEKLHFSLLSDLNSSRYGLF